MIGLIIEQDSGIATCITIAAVVNIFIWFWKKIVHLLRRGDILHYFHHRQISGAEMNSQFPLSVQQSKYLETRVANVLKVVIGIFRILWTLPSFHLSLRNLSCASVCFINMDICIIVIIMIWSSMTYWRRTVWGLQFNCHSTGDTTRCFWH